MLAGTRGNCTIKVGSTDESTLTVGATWPELQKLGTRNCGGAVGKVTAGVLELPPLLVFVPLVFDVSVEPGPVQAFSSRQSSTIATSTGRGRPGAAILA